MTLPPLSHQLGLDADDRLAITLHAAACIDDPEDHCN
jgi:hypothetical protein